MAPIPQLGPRTRKILRYVLITILALVTFVFALQLSFPYDRVRDKMIEALSDKYEVQIGGVERSIKPGRVYFTAVTLRTRQTKPDETVTTFFIKRLELDVGILSLLGGTVRLDMNAQIGAGTLGGHVAVGKFGKGNIEAHFSGQHLPGDALPMRALLGLPMSGKIEFDVSMTLPMEKSKLGKQSINWPKATASFTLGCPSGCTFGDGKTKLKPLLKNTRNQVMVGEGIDFGKITMDSMLAKASMKGGKLTVDKFDTKSKDGELHVDYTMTLEKDFGESMVAGCLRFKGSDDLMKREPKTFAALQTTGAELRGDGLFHIRLTDRFKDMKRLNQECGPGTNANGNGENFGGNGGGGGGGGRGDRPNLTIQPDHAPGSATPPTPMEKPPEPPGGTAHDAGVNPTGAPPSVAPPPATPVNASNTDGPGSSGNLSQEPPRERPGEQQRIQPRAEGGEAPAAPATPPPE